jgi:hypothetical protein
VRTFAESVTASQERLAPTMSERMLITARWNAMPKTAAVSATAVGEPTPKRAAIVCVSSCRSRAA